MYPHVPRLYPSVSQALQRPLEQSVAALLPSSETGEAEAEARLCLLAEAWAEALAAAAALGAALRGGDAAVAHERRDQRIVRDGVGAYVVKTFP